MRRLACSFSMCIWMIAISLMAQGASDPLPPGIPSPGDYKPPALSLDELMQKDTEFQKKEFAFAVSGDKAALRTYVEEQASKGDILAELILGEQFIPPECTFAKGKTAPEGCPNEVSMRPNPFGVEPSFESAISWLSKASDQGSGEASEILAQLIDRMVTSHESTSHTMSEVEHYHQLARSQGFDAQASEVSCYTIKSDGTGALAVSKRNAEHNLSDAEMEVLRRAGRTGIITWTGTDAGGSSVLLTRPDGPPTRVILVLDHAPNKETRLPLPRHASVMYVQHGETWLSIAADDPVTERSIVLLPEREDMQQVTVFVQGIDGSFSGGNCGAFPITQ